MAGEWIKMRRELLSSPKIIRIMSACKADRFRTIGGVFAAWCLFDEHSPDGVLLGYTPETLDEIVGFPGLASAMIAVGWITFEPDSARLIATNFEKHNGNTAKRRAQDSVRKMSAREADRNRTPSSSYSSSYSSSPNKKKGGEKKTMTEVPTGVDPVAWSDWLLVRKSNGKPLTATAWKAIENQAALAGISIGDCVRTMAESGWCGFRAEWLERGSSPQSRGGSRQKTFADLRVERTQLAIEEFLSNG